MRDLRYTFKNTFNTARISMNKLLAGSTDHLGRLSARNGEGDWTLRIAATSTALQGLYAALSDDLSKQANRASRVQAKNEFRLTNITSEVNKILGAANFSFGKNSAEVRNLFPQGVSLFHNATDDGLTAHLNQLVESVTAYQAELGAPVVSMATDLRDAWVVIHAASEDSSAAKTMTVEEKNQARQVLQRELYITLLEVSIAHIDQPGMLGNYFMPHLFGGPPISVTTVNGGSTAGGSVGSVGSTGSIGSGSGSAGSSMGSSGSMGSSFGSSSSSGSMSSASSSGSAGSSSGGA